MTKNSNHKQRVRAYAEALGVSYAEAHRLLNQLGVYETPWRELNNLLSGGYGPGLHIIYGAPGSGKTRFIADLTRHSLARGLTPLPLNPRFDPSLNLDTVLERLESLTRHEKSFIALDEMLEYESAKDLSLRLDNVARGLHSRGLQLQTPIFLSLNSKRASALPSGGIGVMANAITAGEMSWNQKFGIGSIALQKNRYGLQGRAELV